VFSTPCPGRDCRGTLPYLTYNLAEPDRSSSTRDLYLQFTAARHLLIIVRTAVVVFIRSRYDVVRRFSSYFRLAKTMLFGWFRRQESTERFCNVIVIMEFLFYFNFFLYIRTDARTRHIGNVKCFSGTRICNGNFKENV